MRVAVLDADDLFVRSVDSLRDHLKNRQLGLSQTARWRIETNDEVVVSVGVPATDLSRNLQTDAASAPLFALFLAWWFERLKLFGDRRVRVRVDVVDGEIANTPDAQRAIFVAHELATLLPERFECAAAAKIHWPARPVLRTMVADNYATSLVSGVERQIETLVMGQQGLADQFAAIDKIEGFRRFPSLGLFDEGEGGDPRKGTAMRKGPAGRSQIQVAASSSDGRAVHVFALKDLGNSRFGIVSEAFWLARLLHRVRTGDLGGVAVAGGGDELHALRRAERIAMWLLVQDVHPFVRVKDDSPLAWLRAAMKDHGVTLGVLPYDYDRGKGRVILRADRRWA